MGNTLTIQDKLQTDWKRWNIVSSWGQQLSGCIPVPGNTIDYSNQEPSTPAERSHFRSKNISLNSQNLGSKSMAVQLQEFPWELKNSEGKQLPPTYQQPTNRLGRQHGTELSKEGGKKASLPTSLKLPFHQKQRSMFLARSFSCTSQKLYMEGIRLSPFYIAGHLPHRPAMHSQCFCHYPMLPTS